MEKLNAIITIASLLIGAGGFGIARKLIKELKELVKKYKDYKVGGFTEKEQLDLANESIDVIEELIKLGNLFKRTFKKS